MQIPQGLDAPHSGELFPVNEHSWRELLRANQAGKPVQFFGRSRDGHDAPHTFCVMTSPSPSRWRALARRAGALG
jgi:hypothetical protein